MNSVTRYEQRINDLEQSGLNTSDAQGVLDAEIIMLSRRLSKAFNYDAQAIQDVIEAFYSEDV